MVDGYEALYRRRIAQQHTDLRRPVPIDPAYAAAPFNAPFHA
jgi:hypothetical protein